MNIVSGQLLHIRRILGESEGQRRIDKECIRRKISVHHVDWGQSLGGAVGAHGLGDVPAHMHLHGHLDWVGEVRVGQ